MSSPLLQCANDIYVYIYIYVILAADCELSVNLHGCSTGVIQRDNNSMVGDVTGDFQTYFSAC